MSRPFPVNVYPKGIHLTSKAVSFDPKIPYEYSPSELLAAYRAFWKEHVPGTTTNNSEVPSPTRIFDPPKGDVIIQVAAVQLSLSGLQANDVSGIVDRATQAVKVASFCNQHVNAKIALLPELWSGPYFCQSQEAALMELADPIDGNPLIEHMQVLAKKFKVILPISIYERYNNAFYNSIVVIDSDGSLLKPTASSSSSNGDNVAYRKSHIPDGTGYQEKFYFTPGDSGFCIFTSKESGVKLGVAICWGTCVQCQLKLGRFVLFIYPLICLFLFSLDQTNGSPRLRDPWLCWARIFCFSQRPLDRNRKMRH
jgi:predicted amidohydrolase